MRPSRLKTGARVSFQLGAVVCPEMDRVIGQVGLDLEVTGEVVFFSDGGGRQEAFAIVEVPGLVAPVIVPVSELTWRTKRSRTAARGRRT